MYRVLLLPRIVRYYKIKLYLNIYHITVVFYNERHLNAKEKAASIVRFVNLIVFVMRWLWRTGTGWWVRPTQPSSAPGCPLAASHLGKFTR